MDSRMVNCIYARTTDRLGQFQSVCRFLPIKMRVLGVYQFIQNNLTGPVPDIVHPGTLFHFALVL